jgi:hypothetical protein
VQNKSDVISSVTPANKAGRGAARGILAPSLPVVSDAPGIAPDQPKPPGRKITGLDEYTLAD